MNKKPNVIFATIVSARYDTFMDRYRIDVMDNATQMTIQGIKARFENVTPRAGGNITMWFNPYNVCKYVAYDDVVVTEIDGFDMADLDPATKQHLNEYRRIARARLKIKKRISDVAQRIAVINMINTKHNSAATNARHDLIKFLNAQTRDLRRKLKETVYQR